MIEKVSYVSYVEVPKISKKDVKKNEENKEKLVVETGKNGLEVLANYNKIKTNLFQNIDIKPLSPIIFPKDQTHQIVGERIYDSNGKLHSIVNENDNVKTTYIPSEDDENMFKEIMTYDKKSGKRIFYQGAKIEDGKYVEIEVQKMNPLNPNEQISTYYVNGKIEAKNKYISRPDGSEYSVHAYSNGEISIGEYKKKGNISKFTRMSKDKNEINFDEDITSSKGRLERHISFYNGTPIEVRETKTKTLPNLLNMEILMDKDLKPLPRLNVAKIENDLKENYGEKTYYSNNKLESNKTSLNGVDVLAKFSPSGKLEKVESEYHDLEILDKDHYIITARNDEAKNVTKYFGDSTVVEFTNDNKKKSIRYVENGIPLSYNEYEIDKNGEEKCKKSYYFDDNGIVSGAYDN